MQAPVWFARNYLGQPLALCAASQDRQHVGGADVGQFLANHVPEDQVVHRAGIFGHIPLARTDDGIGGFAGGINDCLNVLSVHERVNGGTAGFFSPVCNRLPKA
jgi:hypothetical protein